MEGLVTLEQCGNASEISDSEDEVDCDDYDSDYTFGSDSEDEGEPDEDNDGELLPLRPTAATQASTSTQPPQLRMQLRTLASTSQKASNTQCQTASTSCNVETEQDGGRAQKKEASWVPCAQSITISWSTFRSIPTCG